MSENQTLMVGIVPAEDGSIKVVISESNSPPLLGAKTASGAKNALVKDVPAKSGAEASEESIIKKDPSAEAPAAGMVDSDKAKATSLLGAKACGVKNVNISEAKPGAEDVLKKAKAMFAAHAPRPPAVFWSKFTRPTGPPTAPTGAVEGALKKDIPAAEPGAEASVDETGAIKIPALKPATKVATALKPAATGGETLPSIKKFPEEEPAPAGDADWNVSTKEFPEETAAPAGISEWTTPSKSRRNNERKEASAPTDCGNGYGPLLGSGGNESIVGGNDGKVPSKATRGSTPSATKSGATVKAKTVKPKTPKTVNKTVNPKTTYKDEDEKGKAKYESVSPEPTSTRSTFRFGKFFSSKLLCVVFTVVVISLGCSAFALSSDGSGGVSEFLESVFAPVLGARSKLRGNEQSYCLPRDTSVQPPVKICQLVFTEVDFATGDGFSAHTRGYQNETDPMEATPMGPTIEIWPGDTLKITLKNRLKPPKVSTSGVHNYYHDFQVTNVHTHGLHIGGEKHADSVFISVEPGDDFDYVYYIPEDHMPGTHWYHPHKHGSTAAHAGGGGVGMIIVRDPPGTLPKFLEGGEYDGEGPVPEVQLVVLGLTVNQNVNAANDMAKCCKAYNDVSMDYTSLSKSNWIIPQCGNKTGDNSINQSLWQTDRDNLLRNLANGYFDVDQACDDIKVWNSTSDGGDFFLVNGEVGPNISIAADGWVRFRIVYANIGSQLYFSMPEGCEMELIAKDGIYLSDAPRRTSYAFLGSGNRADILVRCEKNPQFEGAPLKKTCAVDGGLEYKDCWEYEIKAWYYNFRGDSTSDVCDDVVGLKAGQTAANISKTLLNAAENSDDSNITIVRLGTILAIAEDGVSRCELPEFRVNHPCYLADLTNLTDQQLTEQAGYLPEGQRHLHFGEGFGGTPPTYFPAINGQIYGDKGFDMHDEPDPDAIGSNEYLMKPNRTYSMPVGSLQEFEIKGVNFHAFHWHVNPFQLQVDFDEFGFPAGPNTTSPEDRDWNQDTNADRPKAFERSPGSGERPFENYFKKGDWGDVLQIPAKWCAPISSSSCNGKNCTPQQYAQYNASFRVRTNLDHFPSRQVVHCHILDHEDRGMMTLLDMQNYKDWKGNWSKDYEKYDGNTTNPGTAQGHNLLAYGGLDEQGNHRHKQLGKCYGPGPANVPNTGDWSHHPDWGKTNMCCSSDNDCRGEGKCVDGNSVRCGVAVWPKHDDGRNLLFSSLPEHHIVPDTQRLIMRNCHCIES